MSDQVDAVTAVHFPSPADDVAKPVTDLLHDLSLLGTAAELEKADGASGFFFGPPQSVAILEAGATAATKAWTALFGAGATAAGLLTAINGFKNDSVHVAMVAGLAFFTAAMVIGIALIVGTDLRIRGNGAAAVIHARSLIATNFLSLSHAGSQSTSTTGETVWVSAALAGAPLLVLINQEEQSGYQPVTGVRLDGSEGLQIRVVDDWVPASRVKLFKTSGA